MNASIVNKTTNMNPVEGGVWRFNVHVLTQDRLYLLHPLFK